MALSRSPTGVDLNDDHDTTDTVVFLARGNTPPENLKRAAVALALSDKVIAALISERADGAIGPEQ